MEWFTGSIPEAVAEAKRNNKLFLVYIEGTDDMSQTMTSTYNDAAIVQKLRNGNVIALKLAANSVPFKQFCAIYPVLIIPSSYFIGVNGAPIEIVTGSLVPTEFSSKIDKIFEVHDQSGAGKRAVPAQDSASVQASSSKDSVPFASPKEEHVESNEPSTSQSPEDGDAPIEDKVERAKALLEVKKRIKEEEEKEKEKKLELERRSVGKALQKSQQEKSDRELKEWAKNRAKEKEEERLAREKVKAMIAQDRAERAARYEESKDMEKTEKERLAKIREEQERSARSAALNSDSAHIQFRLPDGSSTNHIFSADSSLDDARNFVIKEVCPPFSRFTLCTTFPRRQFTVNNYSESLRDLQLAPSAVLLVLPDQSVSSVYNGGNFFLNIFWTVISPLTSLWSMLRSFFGGTSQNNEQTPPQNPEPSASQNAENSSQSGARRRDTSFARREGNVYRINNQSDDDENNTWNGNSTQQK